MEEDLLYEEDAAAGPRPPADDLRREAWIVEDLLSTKDTTAGDDLQFMDGGGLAPHQLYHCPRRGLLERTRMLRRHVTCRAEVAGKSRWLRYLNYLCPDWSKIDGYQYNPSQVSPNTSQVSSDTSQESSDTHRHQNPISQISLVPRKYHLIPNMNHRIPSISEPNITSIARYLASIT
uniref:Uncharacterized protein n=1 Tax=Oryza punctata TaxID=4537 RepID=A0A0E0L9U0_ORYPU